MIKRIISWLLVMMTGIFSNFITINYADLQRQTLENKLNSYMAEMTLEEKIGQMLMVSFYEHQLEDYLINKKIGGYILFNNNIQGIKELQETTQKIRELGRTHLISTPFISIDQEGGIVSRLDSLFYPFPGNMALGATGNLDLALQQGRLTGRMLRYLGINTNFAPVVDVNSDYRNPIIGLRSFGNNSNIVAELAGAFSEGQKSVGVISSIKHFPGHGNVAQDSHLQLPTNYYSLNEVREIDMLPFDLLIEEGVDMVMTAHIKIPVLDENFPATLSSKILQDELRGRLGYNGVIITDDIGSMKAITTLYPTEEAALRGIEAGADLLLVVASATKVNNTLQEIIKAVETGRITEERIDESVFRILELKYRYGLFHQVEESQEDYEGLYQDTIDHSKAVADQAVTTINNELNLYPFEEEKVLFLVQSSRGYTNPETKKRESFEDLVKVYYNDYRVINIGNVDINRINQLLPQYNRVILLSEKGYQNRQVSVLLNYLRNNDKFILISLAEPYEAVHLGDFHSHLAVYSSQRESVISAIEAIKGMIPIKGSNPVPVNIQ